MAGDGVSEREHDGSDDDMTIIDKVWEFITRFHVQQGEQPPFVPITQEEYRESESDVAFLVADRKAGQGSALFGVPTVITPYASAMREVKLPVTVLAETATIDEFSLASCARFEEYRNQITYQLIRQMKVDICTQKTDITVEVDCEPWPRWRKLWKKPMRTKKVVIRGTVLYPHLKLKLPMNRHYVQWSEVKTT